jgi:predicted signal transduction protein with EAL and GGDEF domain
VLAGATAEAAEDVAERVLEALAEPIVIGGHEIVMTASVGIAYATSESDAHELLRNADLAMYVAKASGRDRYDTYHDAMHDRAVERLQLEADLRDAVAAGDIIVDCQPIVDLRSGVITGAEVLARWSHHERGPVSPGVFIPVAERTGLIGEIGEQVFVQACEISARLAMIDPTLTVTVNVSPVQLSDETLPATFARHLADHGVDPQRIVVEVTETVLMQDVAASARRLAELRKIGVRIAVDDFGVGHSSLSYLRNLPVDVLKIDKSFVDGLPSGADLARMMIQLGRMLGLDVVAEGVESEVQRDELQNLGCPRAQGYLFARPMNPDELVQRLREGSLASRGATRSA